MSIADAPIEKKKRKGCGCGIFTAGCVAGFLALPVFLLLCAFVAWQFPVVKQAVTIGMLHVAPRESMKLRAMEKLENFPDDKTKIALTVYINRVNFQKEKPLALRALAALCKISGQNFGTTYAGEKDMASLQALADEDWKTVKSNVMRWAFQTLRKEGQSFPVPMPEMTNQNQGQNNTVPQTLKSPATAGANAKIASLIGQISNTEPAVGVAAWTALGSMYQNPNDYINAVRSFLDDRTPISFSIIEEIRQLSNGGQGRVFTAKDIPVTQAGEAALARTVGEALRFHVWHYEHAYEANYSGDFYEWWKQYAQERGLPAGRHFTAGIPDED